jgi:hypothetical protein
MRALERAAEALASDYPEAYWRLRDAARDVEATLDALTEPVLLLSTPLTTPEDARTWLRALEEHGYAVHPDTRGADIVSGDTGAPTYTPEQAAMYDARMTEVFALLPDPYSVTLDLMTTTTEETR